MNVAEHIGELLTVQEAAAELRYSVPTVRRLIGQGLLPVVQVAPHHAIRVRRDDLNRITAARPRSAA
jgi:excisionase family DNA binding protein